MSFEEAYEKYLVYAKKRHKKESFNSLQSAFKSRIIPYFKSTNLYDLTIRDFENWENTIFNLKFSNNYNEILYFGFLAFLDYCVDFLNFPENYLKSIGCFQKRYEDKKIDFYTLEEFNRFIKFVDNTIYKRFFEVMFYCGTRPGETMALQFKDLKGDYLSVNKTITSHNGREFDFPKTKSSIRDIKLDKVLKKDLLDLKGMYCDCNGDYFIFGGSKPLAPTTINRYKKKACERAGIRPITLHQFRHSHATLLVNNGILINEVSRRLGHSQVSTTLDIYVHTNLEHEKRVYDTLNSLRFNFFNSLQSVFKNFISLLKHFTMF